MKLNEAMRKTDLDEVMSVLLVNGVKLKCSFETLIFEDDAVGYCVRILNESGDTPESVETMEAVLEVSNGVFSPGTLLELQEGDVAKINGEKITEGE